MKYSRTRHNKTCRHCLSFNFAARAGFVSSITHNVTAIAMLMFCSTVSAGSLLGFLNPFSAHNQVEHTTPDPQLAKVSTMSVGTAPATNPSIDLFYHSYNNTRAMDNAAMENAASALYENNPANLNRSEINQQWLSSNPDADTIEGRKVLSRFAQGIFKTYWKNLKETRYKDNHLVPDSSGTWDNDSGMDYNVRMSEDEIKLRLTYEF